MENLNSLLHFLFSPPLHGSLEGSTLLIQPLSLLLKSKEIAISLDLHIIYSPRINHYPNFNSYNLNPTFFSLFTSHLHRRSLSLHVFNFLIHYFALILLLYSMTNVSDQQNVATPTNTSTHTAPVSQEKPGKVPSSVLGTMSKQDLSQRDFKGRTILHLLILTNKYDLLRRFFKNPDAKSILYLTDYESGWNCLHYCVYFKRLLCLRALMDYLKLFSPPGAPLTATSNTVYLELLRCKDRDRKTPLQLWDNDYKDLMQIPKLISQNGSYNFEGRWDGLDQYQKSSIRCNPDWWHEFRGGSDLLVLGSNQRFNLGIGQIQKSLLTPTRVDLLAFQRPIDSSEYVCNLVFAKTPIKEVKIRKYHSIAIDTYLNSLYSCGVGSRGRLGQRDTKTDRTHFEKVNDGIVKLFDTSNLHTVVVSENSIYAFGANEFHQLGFESDRSGNESKSEIIELEPQEIFCRDLRRCIGVAVSDVHTLLYSDHDIFFYGLCLGQLAFQRTQSSPVESAEYRVRGKLMKGTLHSIPGKFNVHGKIKLVATCATATVIVTEGDDIQVHFQNRFIKMPRIPSSSSIEDNFDIFKPTVMTRAVEIKKIVMENHDLVCFLLTNGDVKSIQINESIHGPKLQIRYQNLWKAHNYDMMAVDIDLSNNGSVILCTRSGSVFVKDLSGTFGNMSQRKNSMSELTSAIKQSKNKFRKLECLNKIARLSCDSDFNSFAFIRDEVDILSGTIDLSTITSDIGYLHSCVPLNFHRKQDEMLAEKANSDNDSSSVFLSKFFLPINHTFTKSSLELAYVHDRGNFERVVDFIPDLIHSEAVNETLTEIPYLSDLMSYLVSKSEEEFISLYKNTTNDKNCDVGIHLTQYDVNIGIHSCILAARVPYFYDKLLKAGSSDDPCVFFSSEDLKGTFNTNTKEITIDGELSIKALLILLFYIYSSHELEPWYTNPSGFDELELNKIKTSYYKLESMFHIDWAGYTSKKAVYLDNLASLLHPMGTEDLTVQLDDGFVTCNSVILLARCAYFETLFSLRWEEGKSIMKEITLENASVKSFKAVLKYIHGGIGNIFDELLDKDEMKLANSDEFVNALLDLVGLADELLLFDLKNICQIAISNFLTVDNVWLLLMHAEYLNSRTLFSNCCWLIYNNLDILVFDLTFKEIPLDLLAKVESCVAQLSKCRDMDFADGTDESNKFYEKECLPLLTQFLNNLDLFNRTFVEGFVPLVDTRKEQKESKKPKRMLSVINAQDSLLKIRSTLNESSESLNYKTQNGLLSSSSAIEETETAFEPVIGRRRRKSSRNTSIEPIIVPGSSERIITPTGSQGDFAPITSSPGVRTDYTWTFSGGSSPKPQPIFGKDIQDVDKKHGKIKMVPRLSQKERRKASLNLESSVSKSAPVREQSSTYLWATSMSNSQSSFSSIEATSPSVGSALSWASNTPILGGEKLKIPKSPILGANGSGPTLSEIMAQQSISNEIQKDQGIQKKTLQEIQQEQEFAKWWEEETARIQKSNTQMTQKQANGKKGRKKKTNKLEPRI